MHVCGVCAAKQMKCDNHKTDLLLWFMNSWSPITESQDLVVHIHTLNLKWSFVTYI